MLEQYNIEWKSTLRDEYLKWICGFSKVQQVCREQGYPEPRLEVLGEALTVTSFAANPEKKRTSNERKRTSIECKVAQG